MKKLSIIIFAAAALVSCKGKDSLQSDKNIVVLTDTSRASGSYLSDTGVAKIPVGAVAAAPVRTAPVTRTNATTQRTTVYKPGTSSSSTTTTTTTNNGGNGTTTSRKTGWSKSAKGAVIGGVGGAVVGAVVGKGKGAIIGGVLGATGGYIIGRGQDKKDGRIP